MMKNKHGRIDLLTQEQIDWCDEYCNFRWFVKDDGKVYSKNDEIEFKNKDSLVSFLVIFGDCEYFKCSGSVLLTSLKGVSKIISEDFICSFCGSLESLEGAPKSVGGDFGCFSCKSLKTLKGSPESVGGNFDCSWCKSLKSLKGASKNIYKIFNCAYCDSLESLEGAPENVNGDFYCFDCKSLKYIDELKNIQVNGRMIFDNCPNLEKYNPILSDINVFRVWQKSELTADEFIKEYLGFIEAKKYGI